MWCTFIRTHGGAWKQELFRQAIIFSAVSRASCLPSLCRLHNKHHSIIVVYENSRRSLNHVGRRSQSVRAPVIYLQTNGEKKRKRNTRVCSRYCADIYYTKIQLRSFFLLAASPLIVNDSNEMNKICGVGSMNVLWLLKKRFEDHSTDIKTTLPYL